MNETKIQFSKSEAEMMCSADFILTKNRILEKVKLLFEVLQEEFVGLSLRQPHANGLFDVPPKISKGENYVGLPYLILDYPRLFKPEDIFAVRTMFWWGNFFSTTLHLSGLPKITYGPILKKNSELLAENDFYVGINTNPWAHHFGETNYRKMGPGETLLVDEGLTSHLKLATNISLDEWPSALDALAKNWKLLMAICGLVATDPVK